MSIERIEKIPYSSFEEKYLLGNRPLIITGACSDWTSVQTWNLESISRKFADETFPIEVLPDDKALDNSYRGAHLKIEHMTLGKYFKLAAESGNRYYLAQVPFRTLSQAMQKDLGKIAYLPNTITASASSFWISFAGAASGIHYDRGHNLVVQVVGSKKWVLFPYSQLDLLYLPSKELGHFSPVVLDHPDYERHPKYRNAKPMEFILEAGEILFVPRYWPHAVKTLEFSVNLNCFFNIPGLSQMLQSLRIMTLEARATAIRKLNQVFVDSEER